MEGTVASLGVAVPDWRNSIFPTVTADVELSSQPSIWGQDGEGVQSTGGQKGLEAGPGTILSEEHTAILCLLLSHL